MPQDLPLVASDHPSAHIAVEQDQGSIARRSVLPGGVRVLTEHMPGIRSATLGAWIGAGSRDENAQHAGSTHFLEHLLFKGTARRDALDIAEAFDRVGGESNAMTGKEYTCYYARVVDTDLPMAIDVTLDMITSASIDVDDFETERGVILEELAMNDDDPGDVVHERFAEAVMGGHPLGRPIGGTPAIIRSVSRDAVWEHYGDRYQAHELVVVATGGVDHDSVCQMVSDALATGGWHLPPNRAPRERRDPLAPVEATVGPDVIIARDIEQSHVIVGTQGFRTLAPERAAFGVMSSILGGGMSSRLFQEIREKRGLTYSVYSFASPYVDAGTFGMYAAAAPNKVDECIKLMTAELEKMADGVTESELERAKGQAAGGLVLRLEDSFSRMSRLGKSELSIGELWSISESLDEVRKVTSEQVAAVARTLAERDRVTVRVGPGA